MKYAVKLAFGLLLVVASRLPMAAAEHPVKLEKDANCADCHEDKTKGKAVHSAIAMGCTTCHDVKTEGETTTVELSAPKEQLCLTCHEQAKEEVKHGPYEKGQCVTCHDPHTSDYAKQLRAEGNKLCLECHQARKAAGEKVVLFGSRDMKSEEFRAIPKIYLDAELKAGHPLDKHPVAGPHPVAKGQQITCTTCHAPHSSSTGNLILVSKAKPDICASCHSPMDKADTERAVKLNELEAQRSSGKPPVPVKENKDKKKN